MFSSFVVWIPIHYVSYSFLSLRMARQFVAGYDPVKV